MHGRCQISRPTVPIAEGRESHPNTQFLPHARFKIKEITNNGQWLPWDVFRALTGIDTDSSNKLWRTTFHKLGVTSQPETPPDDLRQYAVVPRLWRFPLNALLVASTPVSRRHEKWGGIARGFNFLSLSIDADRHLTLPERKKVTITTNSALATQGVEL